MHCHTRCPLDIVNVVKDVMLPVSNNAAVA